jgi:2-keto-4-pentenoate hydratase
MASGAPCAPIRDVIDRGDVARAYRVQKQIIDAALAKGDRRFGRKIGLTSVAVQTQLGVQQPDFGTLLASMVADEGQPVETGRLLQPRIEAEIAFALGEASLALAELDPIAVTMTMTQDGERVSSGDGAACLGNPLIALQWLARVSAELGDPLSAGEVILSGALGPMVSVQAGSTYEATLVGLGSVSATFASPNDQRK